MSRQNVGVLLIENLYKTDNRKADISKRRTLYNVPTDDFYLKLPLKTDISKIRKDFYSNWLKFVWNRVQIILTDKM